VSGARAHPFLGCCALVGALAGLAGAQPAARPQGADSTAASPRTYSVQHVAPLPRDSVAKLAPGLYRVGGVTIDANRRAVSVDGHVNMASGVVELLACARYGKTHESVFVVDAEPYHIQVGLLLLGLEPSPRPLRFQGDKASPKGDSVRITVAWVDSSGRRVEVPAEDAVLDQRTGRQMERTPWVFVGSRIVGGYFEAQVEGNVVTTYHDPATIIDNPLQGGGDDTVYAANPGVVPRVGTAVTLTFTCIGPPRRSAAAEESPR
jgi:hypothetical protein